MSISQSQMRGLLTKAYLAAYNERTPATNFLQSFFKKTSTTAKEVHVEVRRGTEKIAVDIIRGTGGNRNTFSLGSEKGYVPPMYDEYFDITQLDRYERVFGQSDEVAGGATIGYLASDVADKYLVLRDKIERAKELQAMQVFETGVVTLSNGDDINYKRKAASIKDNSAAPWSTASSPIENQIVAGCNFLRQKGKNSGGEVNLVMNSAIFAYLKASNYFTTNANFQQVMLIDVNMPQRNSNGAVYNGRISAGGYLVHLWTYDEGYETNTGVWTPYMHAKKVFMTPVTGTRFEMAHAGIPAIMGKTGRDGQFISRVSTDYYRWDYIDYARTVHNFHIASAPLAIPVTVDMIYTMTVLA